MSHAAFVRKYHKRKLFFKIQEHLTVAVELEGFVRSINGHRDGANSSNGLLQSVFVSFTDVDETLVLGTSSSWVVVAFLILLKWVSIR